MIIKAILWPIKKIILFPLKVLFYTTLLFIVSVLFFQYRANYDVDVSPLSVAEYENCLDVIDDYDVTIDLLSQYVDRLDSQQQSFLYSYLPDLKNYLQAGRFPGIGGKALAPQAASLCRGGLS